MLRKSTELAPHVDLLNHIWNALLLKLQPHLLAVWTPSCMIPAQHTRVNTQPGLWITMKSWGKPARLLRSALVLHALVGLAVHSITPHCKAPVELYSRLAGLPKSSLERKRAGRTLHVDRTLL